MKTTGKIDQWDLPSDGYGDCEDYQLLKRKLLVEAGLPRRAVRMTIGIDEMEKGHALLTVRTPGEDLIVDNRRRSGMGSDRLYIREARKCEPCWLGVPGPSGE